MAVEQSNAQASAQEGRELIERIVVILDLPSEVKPPKTQKVATALEKTPGKNRMGAHKPA
jgi:hypothetical protein